MSLMMTRIAWLGETFAQESAFLALVLLRSDRLNIHCHKRLNQLDRGVLRRHDNSHRDYAFNSAASALWGALIMRGRLQLQTAMSFAFGLTLSVLVVLLLAVKNDLPIFRQNFEFRPGAADIRDEWVLDDRGYPEWWEFAAPLGCLVLAAVGDAAYESQPLALLQVWFRDERVVSAVAIKQLWHTLGYTFAFFMGALVSEFATRVAILLAMHIVSFASFCVIFYRSASSSLGEHR